MTTTLGEMKAGAKGYIHIRWDTVNEGVVKFHRETLIPGQDVSAYPQEVQDFASETWTQQVLDNYSAALAAENQKYNGI